MIDLVILFVLLKRDLTMYSIRKRIEETFAPFTSPSFGAINPALKRLEKLGCISTSKIMSDGGKLSVYYSINKEGQSELRKLLLKPFSSNPLQFVSDAKVKLCCLSYLDKAERSSLLQEIKSNALMHKLNAQNILEDDYNSVDFYQKVVLDNTVCEYNNFISMVEGLEKDNERNS